MTMHHDNHPKTDPENTEPKEELQTSSHLDLFRCLHQGVIYLDGDGVITAMNPSASLILGIAEKQLIGKKMSEAFTEIFDEDGRRLQDHMRPYAVALGTGNMVSNMIVGCRHKQSNDLIWLSIQMFPLTVAVGSKPSRLLIIFEDVTERRQVKKELQKAKEYAENLIETANVMIIGLDANGRIKVFNQTAERISGYSKQDLEERNWFEVLVPKDRYPYVWEEFVRLMDGGLPKRFENPILTKTGEERYIVWQNNYLREAGEIVGTISFGIDISARKASETARRESEQRYRILFESSQDAVMMLTPERGFFDANTATINLFGCKSLEEFVAKGPADLSPMYQPDGQISAVKALEMIKIAMLKGSHFFEWTHCTADGKDFFATVLLTRMQLGERTVLQATVRDITEHKRDEETRMVAEKLQSLSVLAGGIAHDFNNLLAAIMGHNQLAMLERDPEVMRQCLSSNEEVFQRMIGLTRQLLTFAKGTKPQMTVCLLDKILKSNAEFFLSGSNVHAEYDIPANLHPVIVDPNQIGQVIQNLVTNARAAMPDGGTLKIKARNLNEESVCFWVIDSGYGIPPHLISQIFDPYFTTKKDQGGSGLGLSICHSIIQKHGGKITVESREGKGTKFRIVLPRAQHRERENRKLSSAPPDMAKTVRKILMIDDERIIREVMSSLLERIGYRAVTAADGKEAIRIFRQATEDLQPFDAVITDLTLPGGMGGEKIMAELLQIDPDLIGIVASGYAEVPIISEFKKYGFRAAISKPFQIQELAAVLANVFGGE